MSFGRKTLAAISVISISTLIVAGTLAWTSLNSQKINEWFGSGNTDSPGATLHDDHDSTVDNDPTKDVYVENWGSEPIFTRVRLAEYMEIGPGAGLKSTSTNSNTGAIIPNSADHAASLATGADINNTGTWTIHIPKDSDPSQCDSTADFHSYWTWEMGGSKYYYPVLKSNQTAGYVDSSSPDGLTANSLNSDGVPAKETLNADVLTMAQWINMGSPIGDYWVIDNDGWAYWASPLAPGDATGLLLNHVVLNENNNINGDYYYGINVLSQMATKDGTATDGSKDNYESFGTNGGWTAQGQYLMDRITGNSTAGDPPEVPAPNNAITVTPTAGIVPAKNAITPTSGSATIDINVITTPATTATASPVPASTNTPAPAATSTPIPISTNIPIPATNTPVPTATNTPVIAATNTPIPAATSTPVPTATNTPIPATTSTPVPTATNTPIPAATSTPVPTATNTPVPTATNTPAPTATNTPVPTATDTPAPTATSTPTPTDTPAPVAKPTLMPTDTPPAGYTAPVISITQGTVIDSIVYAKVGDTIKVAAKSSKDFNAYFLSVNGSLINMEDPEAANYYTITPDQVDGNNLTAIANGTYATSTLVLKSQPVGTSFPIMAYAFNEKITDNNPPYFNVNFELVIIPSDCSGAVKGSDGNIYLKYSNGTYRLFNYNDTSGPVLSKLP